jgi:uncharacterized protein (DUF305 family)
MRRIALVVAAMGLLAACGKAADNDSGAPASSQPNPADAEVSKMQGWLQAWGKPSSGMGEMDHGASPMPGMMGQAEMDELMGLKGTRFDLAFVDMMTRHHQGAIEMATTELGAGSLGEVKRLAQQITKAQQREIQQMATWKQAWS